MTPIKSILAHMQENEKKYTPMEPDKLITDYIQTLQKKNEELVHAFTKDNFNLNLCKTFFSKLIESHRTCHETKRIIKEFLTDLNK